MVRTPVGPCLVITPWNFPLAVPARGIGPALAAGCTVVLRPSSLTPLSALALGRLLVEAGLPDGVLNIVVSSDLDNEVLTSATSTPPVAWDGVHVVLRWQGEERFYYASVNRRDDTVILKKRAGGAFFPCGSAPGRSASGGRRSLSVRRRSTSRRMRTSPSC